MAENNVIDLSDLVKAIEFKFGQNEFTIPPIPDDRFKAIMAQANKIRKIGGEKENPDEDTSDKENEELITNQNIFLSLSIRKKGDEETALKPEDFSSWPLKLKSRVISLVFEQVGISGGENVPAESEKN